MLGFSAISEAPFSQSTVSLTALALLASTASYSNTGGLLYDAKSNTILAGLNTSITAEPIAFDAKAAILFTDALAATSINDLLKVRGASNSTAVPVIATLYAEQFADLDAKAVTYLSNTESNIDAASLETDAQASILFTGASILSSINDIPEVIGASNIELTPSTALISVEAFEDVDAKALTYLSNTQASLDITTVDLDAKASITTDAVNVVAYVDPFEKIIAKANLTPVGVSSLFSLDIDYDAKAIIGISGVDSLLDVDAFQEVIGKANAALVGVSFNVNNYDFLDEDAQASANLIGISGVLHINLDKPDAVAFDYQADAYYASRTVYLVAYDGSDTVHVIEPNKVIYTQAQDLSNTVYITEDSHVVYIAKPNGSNTVHITS